jgi:hypothetical protein
MEITIVRKVANSPEYFTDGIEKRRMAAPRKELYNVGVDCPWRIAISSMTSES